MPKLPLGVILVEVRKTAEILEGIISKQQDITEILGLGSLTP